MSFNSFSRHALPTSSPHPPSSSPHITSDASAASSFAFLNHSQDTLPNNLPPDVDNKGLARQRRRRTSPEDQAILEAEFQKNDRPSREARQAIVRQVALGEKEVQIWFQNRRQLAKRRSRPLLPHELWPPYLNQNTTVLSSPASVAERSAATLAFERANASLGSSNAPDPDVSPDTSSAEDAIRPVPASSFHPSDVEVTSDRASSPTTREQPKANLSFEGPAKSIRNADPLSIKGLPSSSPPTSPTIPNSSQPQPQPEPELEPIPEPIARPMSANAIHDRRKERLRISMSSSGTAKVLRDDESSPSPPRPQSVDLLSDPTFRSIRRSYSSKDLPKTAEEPDSLETSIISSASRRLTFSSQPIGRSRDSRAWEFWCDSEAQQTLAKQADDEVRGSAQGAIRLMRESSRASLLSTSARSNTRTGEGRPSLKRSKSGVNIEQPKTKRRSLSRSQTSTGRLQRPRDSGIGMEIHIDEDCKPHATPSQTEYNDSDKENVDPAPNSAPARHVAHPSETTRRATNPAQTTRRIPALGQSTTAPPRQPKYRGPQALQTLVNVGNTHSWRRPRPVRNRSTGAENDPENDPEIAAFMGRAGNRGARSAGAAGEKKTEGGEADDMDCVAGLLSLSQGAWK